MEDEQARAQADMVTYKKSWTPDGWQGREGQQAMLKKVEQDITYPMQGGRGPYLDLAGIVCCLPATPQGLGHPKSLPRHLCAAHASMVMVNWHLAGEELEGRHVCSPAFGKSALCFSCAKRRQGIKATKHSPMHKCTLGGADGIQKSRKEGSTGESFETLHEYGLHQTVPICLYMQVSTWGRDTALADYPSNF
jgi:hypothetical protein